MPETLGSIPSTAKRKKKGNSPTAKTELKQQATYLQVLLLRDHDFTPASIKFMRKSRYFEFLLT
jgi:hypothetical protein